MHEKIFDLININEQNLKWGHDSITYYNNNLKDTKSSISLFNNK